MMINLKLKCFYLKRRMPLCYLFSSKLILTSSILMFIYFLTMDMILFHKAKNRGTFLNLANERAINDINNINNNNNNSKILSTLFKTHDSNNYNYDQYKDDKAKNSNSNPPIPSSMWWPLPVKKIMMAEATMFVRSPIAEFVEHTLRFSEFFPFISANLISLAHAALSVISIKFLIDDSLFWRQFGVCVFQFRNFLDSFDGVIYRAHAKKLIYKSHYGSMGYFVDAFSDVFGGICLIGSLAIYFLKHRPLNKNLTRCFRSQEDNFDEQHSQSPRASSPIISSSISSSSSSSSNSSSQATSPSSFAQLTNNNNVSNNNSYIHSSGLFSSEKNFQPIKSSQTQFYFQEKSAKPFKANYNSMFATKANVLLSVSLLGIRLGISGLFWDKSVHAYQDLLDSSPQSELQRQLQTQVLSSSITLCIMFAWRLLNALSLQDMILMSIFIDKIWEFTVKTQLWGWVCLIALIILTELHVAEVQSILAQTL